MDMIREILAAGGVIALLAACLWWLRRHGLARYGAARARNLQVVERAALSPQHSLYLVRLAGCGLLVGISPAGPRVLRSFPWESIEPRFQPGSGE